jgi:hypothetical protein
VVREEAPKQLRPGFLVEEVRNDVAQRLVPSAWLEDDHDDDTDSGKMWRRQMEEARVCWGLVAEREGGKGAGGGGAHHVLKEKTTI